AEQRRQVLERDAARRGSERRLADAAGWIVDQVEARRARADRGGGAQGKARLARIQGHRAVRDLARPPDDLPHPRRAPRRGAADAQKQGDIGAEGLDGGPFARDLDVGTLDSDAALDGDLAAAEAALQVDVARQAAYPAIE